MKVERGDFCKRRPHDIGPAWLERHDERQLRLRVARFLQHRVEVQLMAEAHFCDRRDDARAIHDDEAKVLRRNEVLLDLRAHDCDVITIGQYLRPSPKHLPVARYVPPAEFEAIGAEARALGFTHVEAGPLVRSSYHAESQVPRRRPAPPAVEVPLLDTP